MYAALTAWIEEWLAPPLLGDGSAASLIAPRSLPGSGGAAAVPWDTVTIPVCHVMYKRRNHISGRSFVSRGGEGL